MQSTELAELERKLRHLIKTKNLTEKRFIRADTLPNWVRQSIISLTGDIPSKQLYKDALRMAQSIEYRKPEARSGESSDKSDDDQSPLSRAARFATRTENTRINKTEKMFKSRDFFVYNEYSALSYLLSMGIKKFTAVSKIFREIKLKDPEFKPAKLLDMNSGVGSSVWAAHSMWPQHLTKAVHCEDSEYQTKTCRNIHNSNSQIEQFPTLFYRRMAVPKDTFDLIVSGYCLMDHKTRKDMNTYVNQLEEALSDRGYLVFLEASSDHCFKLMLSVRSLLLRKGCNIFSPCPHSSHCPAFGDHGKTCTFSARFEVPELDDSTGATPATKQKMNFTYLVVTKKSVNETKPRLVMSANENHSGTRINRFVCTPNGHLRHIQPSKRHQPALHDLLSRLRNQDELPINVETKSEEEEAFQSRTSLNDK